MKKETVVIPLAGYGRRFRSAGYSKPKQMLKPDSRSNLEHSLDVLDPNRFRLIFVLREDQVRDEAFDKFIEETCSKYDYELVVIPYETRGSVETVMYCRDLIDPEDKLTIFTMDVTFHPPYNSEVFGNADGGVLTFKSNSSNYSYARIDGGHVRETAEKIVLSDSAIVGIYYFKKAKIGHFIKLQCQKVLFASVLIGYLFQR